MLVGPPLHHRTSENPVCACTPGGCWVGSESLATVNPGEPCGGRPEPEVLTVAALISWLSMLTLTHRNVIADRPFNPICVQCCKFS